MAKEKSELVFDLDSTEINNNWMKALRLLRKGTKGAKRKLRRMDKTKMVSLSSMEKGSKV